MGCIDKLGLKASTSVSLSKKLASFQGRAYFLGTNFPLLDNRIACVNGVSDQSRHVFHVFWATTAS